MPLALTHDQFGEPAEVLRLDEVAPAMPGEGEIVIAVEAAAMHVADLRSVQGTSGFRFALPRTPGFEGVGRVVRAGSEVRDFAPGDRVFPPSGSGTFRQELCVAAVDCMPAPEGEAEQLALLTINAPTAHVLLHDFARLTPGDWIIHNGANSSCGRYLIALAAERGVRTVNVVRRAVLAGELDALGADVVLTDGEDLAVRMREATGGVEPVLGIDCVGGAATHRIAQCLAAGSTVVCYGAMSGRRCEMDFYLMFARDIRLVGMSFRRQLKRRSGAEVDAIYRGLAERMADGRLAAKIAATYPLALWREAFAHAARTGDDRDGKVILLP